MQRKKVTLQNFFDQVKPGVRFVKNGTIYLFLNCLSTKRNLRAVDVKVCKIYSNNIHNFFRIIGGGIGCRPAEHRKFLSKYRKWNTYALDLSQIISEPGTIYRVEFSFKKAYSWYKCKNLDPEDESRR
jgi:hypothetical protein